MDSQRNKQLVSRYLREVVAQGDVEVADELVVDDLVFDSPYTPQPTRDRETFKAMIAGLHAAFPDFHLQEQVVLGEGDLVASRWHASGTHTGADFGALPASGRAFRIAGISIYRLRDGRIVEGWVSDDTLAMARQLGLIDAGVPA